MAAALGFGWTVVLAEDGALHACGRGDLGQLGLNSREHRLQPTRVGGTELPGGAPVVLVAAGGYHWAAVFSTYQGMPRKKVSHPRLSRAYAFKNY